MRLSAAALQTRGLSSLEMGFSGSHELENSLGQNRTLTMAGSMSVVGVRPQPVAATQALNLSAGVSNPRVLRGRSLS